MLKNENFFKSFENSSYQFSPVSWELVYNFEIAENSFPFTNSKCINIFIWGSAGFDKRNNSTYGGMYAYAEVVDSNSGEIWFKSFFGETSEDDALRWAKDKANKELY